MPPYSANNDQPPPVPPYKNEPVTAQYSEVKRENMTPHVMLHRTTAGGDYSVLKREDREVC